MPSDAPWTVSILRRALPPATALLLALPVVAAAQQQAPESFPLWCRGPLEMELQEDRDRGSRSLGQAKVIVWFTRNAGPARDGQALRPGTCAWQDRAVNDKEPDRLLVFFELGHVDPFAQRNVWSNTAQELMLPCAVRSDCAFRVSARNERGAYLLVPMQSRVRVKPLGR